MRAIPKTLLITFQLFQNAILAKCNAERLEILARELEDIKKENSDLKQTVANLNDNLNFAKGEMSNFQRKLEEKEVEIMRWCYFYQRYEK